MKQQQDIVGVLGAGAMGRGIVQIALAGGYQVRLFDANPDAVADAVAFITRMLNRAAEKGQMEQVEAEQAIANLTPVDSMAGFADCDIVVEAILEDLDIKKKVFAGFEEHVSETCVLATNTSSLSVTAIASACAHPERVAGFHFFNPVPLMKVVEVIEAVRTAPEVTAKLTEFAHEMGHRPVGALDTPGFLVNHAGRAFSTEGFRILQEGIADYPIVDDVMRDAAGFRMGPLELLDLTGLDVSFAVMNSIYDQFYQEPRYRPNALAQQRVNAGLFGRKTGGGFYQYEDNRRVPVPPVKAPDALPDSIWIGAATPSVQEVVRELASAAGVPVEDGAAPSEAALCLLSPVGEDATTAALEAGVNPQNTVALDPLFGLESHRTLMTTPVTTAAMRDAAHGLFGTSPIPVSVIHDSPGFVAQRIVACIVNIGADIAQQRIATADDIDPAVKLGLGYPRGPLEWGDELGAKTVLDILEALHDFYGDPRYRPSPWLKRRALLGVPLTTPEG
ncbi:MAG: 3-hydroxyacyl-CoA dehydrogenase [Alphaproteobacteria bacterium]